MAAIGAVSARRVLWLRETPLMVRRLGAFGSTSPNRMVPSVAKSSLKEARISKLGRNSLPDCLRALTVRLWSRSIWFG